MTRNRTERRHDGFEFRIRLEQRDLGFEVEFARRVEAHRPIDDECDDTLVAVKVAQLVTDLERTRLAVAAGDHVRLGELLGRHDRVLQRPVAQHHLRRTNVVDD